MGSHGQQLSARQNRDAAKKNIRSRIIRFHRKIWISQKCEAWRSITETHWKHIDRKQQTLIHCKHHHYRHRGPLPMTNQLQTPMTNTITTNTDDKSAQQVLYQKIQTLNKKLLESFSKSAENCQQKPAFLSGLVLPNLIRRYWSWTVRDTIEIPITRTMSTSAIRYYRLASSFRGLWIIIMVLISPLTIFGIFPRVRLAGSRSIWIIHFHICISVTIAFTTSIILMWRLGLKKSN